MTSTLTTAGQPGLGGSGLAPDQLVALLMHARQDRSPVPAPAVFSAGISPSQGYEVQRLHTQAMLAQYGGRVIETKLGGGDLAAMAALGLSGPFQGPIFSAFTHDSPAQLRRDGFFVCAVEAEIGVLIGEDIGGHPHLPERDVLVHAIEALIPAIEVADSRYADYAQCPPAAILADLGFAGGWVRGAAVVDWNDIDVPKVAVRLLSNGREVRSGNGAGAMGDPLLTEPACGRPGARRPQAVRGAGREHGRLHGCLSVESRRVAGRGLRSAGPGERGVHLRPRTVSRHVMTH